jgi:hypothetical protein
MVVEHLVNVGRRSALIRTAHLLLELGLRLQLVGLGSDSGFVCPLNQYLLADALGLTAIHVNRVLRQLRERGLVTFREGQRPVPRSRSTAQPRRLAQRLSRPERARAPRLAPARRPGGPDRLIQVSAARWSAG